MTEFEEYGFDEAIKGLDKFTLTINDRYTSYLERVANMIIDQARSNLQNNQNINTGTLLASIQILDVSDNGTSILLGSNEMYAVYIEYGRGPVYPKGAKVLHWKDKTTGKDIFSKSAKSTEPMPFLLPAILTVGRDFPDIMIKDETEFIQELLK